MRALLSLVVLCQQLAGRKRSSLQHVITPLFDKFIVAGWRTATAEHNAATAGSQTNQHIGNGERPNLLGNYLINDLKACPQLRKSPIYAQELTRR